MLHSLCTSFTIMAKSQQTQEHVTASLSGQHQAEYAIISRDLVRLVVINTVFLVLLLVVYHTNNQQHYLERWFNHFIHLG